MSGFIKHWNGSRVLIICASLICFGVIAFWALHPSAEYADDTVNLASEYLVSKDRSKDYLNSQIMKIERLLSEEMSARKLLEKRLQKIESMLVANQDLKIFPAPEYRGSFEEQDMNSLSSEPLSDALLRTGISPDIVDQINRRIGANRMALLTLRDKAAREGWIDTPKYIDAQEALSDPHKKIRDKYGDEVYESYLYAQGKSNRVLINDVYPDSAAEKAGLQRGDLILSYDTESIFSMKDLRVATTTGYSGEEVYLKIQRNGIQMDVSLPRGPIGVETEAVLNNPINNQQYPVR